MDAKKTLSVLDNYVQYFYDLQADGSPIKIARCDITKHDIGQWDRLSHAWWACEQAKAYVHEGRMEKAFRWLGFIQGALWQAGHYSIEELANHNRPPEETPNFDPDRKSE